MKTNQLPVSPIAPNNTPVTTRCNQIERELGLLSNHVDELGGRLTMVRTPSKLSPEQGPPPSKNVECPLADRLGVFVNSLIMINEKLCRLVEEIEL